MCAFSSSALGMAGSWRGLPQKKKGAVEMGLLDFLLAERELEAEGDYESRERVYKRINGELVLVMDDGVEVNPDGSEERL